MSLDKVRFQETKWGFESFRFFAEVKVVKHRGAKVHADLKIVQAESGGFWQVLAEQNKSTTAREI